MSLVDALKSEKSGAGKIEGAQIGIVTNNKDPDSQGRVKVRFPARESNDEIWARVATLMAGNNRGSFFLPEVGDEVLVLFEHGDVQHPYIVGALWNGKDAQPEKNSNGKNNIRKIRSRSGHEIIFDDDSDGKKEKVIIKTNAGHSITLDDSSGGEKILIRDKNGNNSILIDSKQNSIQVESQSKLILKSPVIQMEAQSSLTLQSNGTLTIKGTMVKIN